MGTMMEVLQQKGGLGGVLDAFRNSGMARTPIRGRPTGRTCRCRAIRSSRRSGSPIIERDRVEAGAVAGSGQGDAVAARAGDHEPDGGARAHDRRSPPDDLGKALDMFKGFLG